MNNKNKGSALILILIAMFLITTLGLAILSVSVMNLDMKRVDGKSQENFYSAETALDEIEVGLEELETTQIKNAYASVLTNYSMIHPTQREAKFKEYVIDNIRKALCNLTDPSLTPENLRILMTSYVRNTPVYSDSTKVGVKVNAAGTVDATVYADFTNNVVTIKDVYIEYFDGDYTTVIQTDIRMDCPADIVFDNLATSDKTYVLSKYAIIADDGLEVADSTSTSISNIVGNVYAGEHGITLSNYGTMLNISAQEVVTRGDIIAKDKARLSINGDGTNRIWAQNLKCELSSGMESNKDTSMNIHGNCFIGNDLMLNAKHSNVTISGTYQGYQTNKLTKEENGSSVIVNGVESTLDLSGLTQFIVGGNASIEVPSYDNSGIYKEKLPIMTGDSISVKGNQIAYLVPGECISVGHNPVLWEEYNNGVTVNLENDKSINLMNYVDTTLDSEIGYHKIFYKLSSGMNVVYYYLDFHDVQKATDYMEQYNSLYHNKLEEMRLVFPVNALKFGNGITKSNGIATRINQADQDLEIIKPAIDRAWLAQEEAIHKKEYLWMTRRLTTTEDVANCKDINSLAKNFVNLGKIKTDAAGVVNCIVYSSPEYDTYSIKFVYNGEGTFADVGAGEQVGIPYSVDTPTSGILVATGDVKINNNFTGLVIAGGKITIASNASVYADATIINDIWKRGETDINQYFYGLDSVVVPGGSTLEQSINISNLLSYENWRKK